MPPYDVKRDLKQLYAPTNRDWELLTVPPQRFIAVNGRGDPNTAAAYVAAVEALYGVAYAIKFAGKRASPDHDFVVGPLEGLWYADDMSVFTIRAKEQWSWTMMITLPDWVTDAVIADAQATARTKKKSSGALDLLQPLNLDEGLSAQLLHIGSYDEEAPALARLHEEYLPAQHLVPSGHHHEIYLGDPRRTAPAKLKTVVRQPVAPAAA